MWDVLDATPGLRNRAGPRGHVPRPEWRPQTHFETRGQRLGHGVWDLLYDRDSGFGIGDSYKHGRPAFSSRRQDSPHGHGRRHIPGTRRALFRIPNTHSPRLEEQTIELQPLMRHSYT